MKQLYFWYDGDPYCSLEINPDKEYFLTILGEDGEPVFSFSRGEANQIYGMLRNTFQPQLDNE